MNDHNRLMDTFIDAHKDEAVAMLQALLKHNSVEAPANNGFPFGDAVGECLLDTLEKCESLGFSTRNYDNYAGHAEIGTGEEMIALLTHLDIVPAGDPATWSRDPFGAEIDNGRLYARGSLDNKGPAVAGIYAMLALKSSGIPLNKRVRMIFGTNEESGSACIKHYRAVGGDLPTIGFTPDADFPVIHGEKGLMNLHVHFPFHQERSNGLVQSFNGGNAANMVPDKATVELSTSKLCGILFPEGTPNEFDGNLITQRLIENISVDSGLECTAGPSTTTLHMHGISAHGSTPELGVNAISKLMTALAPLMDRLYGAASPEVHTLDHLVRFYNKTIAMTYDGSLAGIGLTDDISGNLVFNVGIVKTPADQDAIITINVRYPITCIADEVHTGFKATCEAYGLKYTVTNHKEPLYVPLDSALVQKLLGVYNGYFGKSEVPITIGGGTYAREMPNIVAFGPMHPGQIDTMHQKDEFIEIEHFLDLAKVYARAIASLMVD